MKIIADLHIHSKYSRATSPQMDLEHLSKAAELKGINLLGTGDFTHPLWLEHLKKNLRPGGGGLYQYNGVNYMLTGEVSNIYYKNGRGRKIHHLILAPGFEVVEEINRQLSRYGKIEADGRPIISIDSTLLAQIIFSISKNCLIIPAHAWTPHFSIFGSNSGFDSVKECFAEFTGGIFALETGLSSDPEMNWCLSALDNFALVSNSDAHSPNRIGREANVFETEMDYWKITEAIKNKDKEKFLNTIEFFPEEGKYHYDGHRSCGIVFNPQETEKHSGICPKCGRRLTVGVMNRVKKLADRELGFRPEKAIPFTRIVPLREIIAESLGVGFETQTVEKEYMNIVSRNGTEFEVLLEASEDKIRGNISPRIAEGIIRMRQGRVSINPGYDGVFGEVKIFSDEEKDQMSLF